MSREILRDPAGRPVGSITIERIASGTRETLRDASDRLLGRWESGADETRDAAGRLVARGNQLLRLLR